MLNEGKTCIITDIDGLKKHMEEKRQKPEFKKTITQSILSLTPEKLKRIYGQNET